MPSYRIYRMKESPRMAELVNRARERGYVVVVDTPPGLNPVVRRVLSLSQHVIVPLQCEPLALQTTTQILRGIRAALNDTDFRVRTAAARCAGMAGDRAAVDRLMRMVKKDQPAARRQAAAALGQIGDTRATAALIAAASDAEDRFVEHSVIYSLITLGQTEALRINETAPPGDRD